MMSKQGMHRETGKLIYGVEYLQQRFDDVLRTHVGQVVCARGFGAQVMDEVDRNTDPRWFMRLYMLIAKAVTHADNGLEDFALSYIRIVDATVSSVTVECVGEFEGDNTVTLGATL
ncbi:hypothetical protein JCM19239_1352 [Vibrio variabilis]|uniref:Uncharacterized protein n=1 Tax=Vibrio variabilis TaxID=990271 RepID=A0ABQ0JR42_9VIBR|nr:hypothetical protein JCM19239_1352 [Vibrio variabilis]